MFLGTLPHDVQCILAETVKGWQTDTVHVGCSGNFTIERGLASIGGYRLFSNDVSLYTSVLGSYFSRQKFRLELKPDSGFEWMEPFMQTPVAQCATVEIATRLTDGLTSAGNEKPNAYFKRITKAYKDNFKTLHEKTVDKILKLDLKIDSYFFGDVMDYIDQVPDDCSFVSYPPFYFGGYTTMFKKLDFIFDWDPPKFTELTDELKASLFQKIASKKNWMFGTADRKPEYEDRLLGITRPTNRGTIFYLYASSGKKRVIMPKQLMEPCYIKRLSKGEEIGSRIALTKLHYKQFQALRSIYMNQFIDPGRTYDAFGVLVDGSLVGAFAASVASPSAMYYNPDEMYMLSDFPVAPTDYKKLSKLIVMAAMSKEAKLLFERLTNHRMTIICTTAFTNNYESMKYRGLLSLTARKENPPAEDLLVNKKYNLNYSGRLGKLTLAESLELWKKKYGERDTHGN